jgi:pectate lyase
MRWTTGMAGAVGVATCVLAGAGNLHGQGLPAFPGAEGHGATATGGRGGAVVHVTNLNASGPGSLQAACAQSGPRIVVFDVSGAIEGDVFIEHGDITIAGETAPGGGITIAGRLWTDYDSSIQNLIVRFVRVRPRDLSGNQGDAIQFSLNRNFILDHVSVSWGSDETIDVYSASDATIQWSTVEESATYAGHPDGNFHNYGLISGPGGGPISVHHTLFAHHSRRSPAIANGPSDVVNVVAYNFHDGFVHHNPYNNLGLNFVGNYWRRGPDRSDIMPFWLDDEDGDYGPYYFSDNWIDDPPDIDESIDDPWTVTYNDIDEAMQGRVRATSPFPTPPITAHSAEEAYPLVLARAGAFPRDVVTLRTVDEVQQRTGSWGREVPADLMEGLTPTAAPPDSDGDGMPDDWEAARGLDPGVADDDGDDDADGYTNVEEYLHERAAALVPGGLLPTLTIDDASIVEGPDGTRLLEFEVHLSEPTPQN